MMSDFVLPMAVKPFPDESLPGLVMRNAAPYHFRTPMRLFARLGLTKMQLGPVCRSDPKSDLANRLRRFMGLDEETFLRMSPWSATEARSSILGHQVWRDLVPSDRRAVCPQCLRDAPYHRAVWQIGALPVCAVHGVRLIDRCPNPKCGMPLKWSGQSHCECEWRGCRFDLRNAEAEPIDLSGLAGVVRLIDLFRCDGLPPATPIAAPVGDILTMAFSLGRVALGFEWQARPINLLEREKARIPELMQAGWAALDNWPKGFEALLAARKAKGTGTRGTAQAFGKLSLQIREWAREPWGGPIGKAFADYTIRQPDLAISSRNMRTYAPGLKLKKTHMSIAEASETLRISPGAVLRLARRRGLFVLEPQGMGVSSLIQVSDIKAMRTYLKGFMLPYDALALLNVGRRLMLELEQAGLIRSLPLEERVLEAKPYLRGEIEAFVAACVGTAPVMSAVEAAAKGLTEITRPSAPGHELVNVCRALVEGRLKSRGTVDDARGLLRARVAMADVHAVLPTSRTTMSVVEAARTIHVKWSNLHVWARRGLLKTGKLQGQGEHGRRIAHEDWQAFRAEYVAGSDLMELFDQDAHHWLSRHLLYQGVKPVSGPDIDEAETFLFRRSDCNPKVVKAIRNVQAGPPGTGQDKHRAAFVKSSRVAKAIEARWDCKFKRTNNFFQVILGSRVLQVVTGRRPDMTGVFRFLLQSTSIERLRESRDAWVAFVPAQGDTFLLMPFRLVEWRGSPRVAQYVCVNFDVKGRPLQLAEHAVSLTPGDGK